jgi:hypothetical protein
VSIPLPVDSSEPAEAASRTPKYTHFGILDSNEGCHQWKGDVRKMGKIATLALPPITDCSRRMRPFTHGEAGRDLADALLFNTPDLNSHMMVIRDTGCLPSFELEAASAAIPICG